MGQTTRFSGRALVPGSASGPLLFADVGLSFWGGIDTDTGKVIDVHHPWQGGNVEGKILALPSGRGSCGGSLAILELLINGHAPKALIFCREEMILTLGVMIAAELFDRGIPVVMLSPAQFAQLKGAAQVTVSNGRVSVSDGASGALESRARLDDLDLSDFDLSADDRAMLDGQNGAAAQLAIGLVIRAAQLAGARHLINVDMAHIDGCFYQGPAGLMYARKLLDLGAKVRVPCTTNAICVDRKQWRALGVGQEMGSKSVELADAYLAMGVRPTFTCAPYLLPGAPSLGQQVAWGESNAVAFANSVLGARTMKYPDYLETLVAITGRAPAISSHTDAGRHATVRIDIDKPRHTDDAFFAALGYHVGKLSSNDIPVLCGLEGCGVSRDDLKGFAAAFATTGSAPMFHVLGVTPEAETLEQATGGKAPLHHLRVRDEDLAATWQEMNTGTGPDVQMVALGNPHLSFEEIAALAAQCAGRKKHEGVQLKITCGRDVYERATAAGHVAAITAFGGSFMNDTCWCFIAEPIIPAAARNLMTNSGKYAHYGAAATGKGMHFASLATCVDALCAGEADTNYPGYLEA